MASFPHLLDQRRLIGPGGSTVAGDLFFYYSGTSVLAPIYNDSGLTIPAENPISVGAGEIIPLIFLDASVTYRRVIVYSDGTRDEEDPLGNLFQESELSMPVGGIMDYAGSTPPSGFLFCFGQEVSRTGLSDLFAAIGTQYGSGNGSTTFNLPDYRGRVGAGKDNMGGVPANRLTTAGAVNGLILGAVGGNQLHLLTLDEIPEHDHTATVTDPGHNHDYTSPAGLPPGIAGNVAGAITQQTSTSFTGITVAIGDTGGDDPHNNVQPTLILNKIIKVQPTTFFSLISTINSDKANATALGITPDATDMGEFTGIILPDNATAKVVIQTVGSFIDDLGTISVATKGSDLVGTPSGATLTESIFDKGDSVAVVGSTAKVDWERQPAFPSYPVATMGSLWPSDKVHWDHAISAEFDATNTPVTTPLVSPASTVLLASHNKGTDAIVVPLQTISGVHVNGKEAAGPNFISYSDPGTLNAKLKGVEIDIQPGAGTTISECFGLALNCFGQDVLGDAIFIEGVFGGRWGSGIRIGALNPSVGAGIYATGSMGALFNSGTGTFGIDAAVFSNTHALRFLGTGGGRSRLFVDAGNFFHFVMPPNGITFRDTTDTTTLVGIDNGGNINLQNGGTVQFASGLSSPTAVAGSNTLPSNPVGFITMNIGGSNVKVPYYGV